MFYQKIFKPIGDAVLAILFLLVLSPLFLFIMVVLLFANRGKPFFYQSRPGKDQRIFNVIKFKTMDDTTDAQGQLLQDKDRLTPVGKFVRKTSLDEIPQLLNVIKGDMSLIGPRPLLVRYLPLYTDFQKRRHEVKPGITGWAQVNGRNIISWEEKFKLDVWYVDHQSFGVDLKIFFKTIGKIIKSEGINAEGQATTKPFTGS